MGPLALTSSTVASATAVAAFCPSYAPSTVATIKITAGVVAYWIGANTMYLARRSQLRGPDMTMKNLFIIRTKREEGVSWKLYATILLTWQAFVLLFPVLEPVFVVGTRRVSFFYSYPRASGCGIILEPRSVQHLQQSQRTKHQIRLDWHRFSMNVGTVGREGYRHPPSVERNLPHLDIPQRGMKHWPWRRKETNNVHAKWSKK